MDKICLVCGRKRESKNDVLPCDYGIHDNDEDVDTGEDFYESKKEGDL